MKYDDHTPEAQAAIEAELVRLTLGGSMTRADMWLPMDLGGQLARMVFSFDAMREDLAERLQPALSSLVQAFAATAVALKRIDPEATP